MSLRTIALIGVAACALGAAGSTEKRQPLKDPLKVALGLR